MSRNEFEFCSKNKFEPNFAANREGEKNRTVAP